MARPVLLVHCGKTDQFVKLHITSVAILVKLTVVINILTLGACNPEEV